MPIIWFLLKTVVFCFIYVWFRAALPRLRYDQLMDLGWKRLIPMTLGWLLLVAGHHHLGLGRADPGAGRGPGLGAADPGQPVGNGRSEEDVIIPVIGSRVTRAPRLSPVTAAPGR